jgi:putative peptide zinc metalloprotease protein
MVTLADSLVASSLRPLGLRVRSDLTARQQRYQGRTYWVVKEPVGLRYFRFQEEEYAVLRMLDGPTSLEDVKQRFETEFAPHKITYQDLQQFIGTLHRSGLVVSDAPGQGYQLKKRRDKRTRQELLGKFSNILAIRFKGIDPEWILNRIYPYTRWLFSPITVSIFAMIGLVALLLITIQFETFRSKLPAFHQFFGPENWLWLGIVLATTKIMHEFGHGLLCKHFGGECHEMGVMFLVLTPCLYCNVSDSWMLPSKWQRAAIGAGGIYVELVLASLATYIWWFSEEGMLNFLALRIMFICSLSTVLFNGNPLLRFDGYYILSDLVEIPNLRQKSSKILQRLAGQVCLGLEMPEDPFLPQRNQGFFALYTVAAVVYRWFIFFSILFFLNKVFEPYGLKVIGQIIALMGIVGLVVVPLWKMGKFFHVPGRMDQVKRPRLYATVGVASFIVLLIVFLPLPRNVKCTMELKPRDADSVWIDVPGRLTTVYVQPESKVNAGDALAKLTNIDLEREINKLNDAKVDQEDQLNSLTRRGATDSSVVAQIDLVRTTLESTKQLLEAKTRDLEKLDLEAPVAGTVLPPPWRPEAPSQGDRLDRWSGSPFDQQNLGAFLTAGERFCYVGDPTKMEAVLAIDQADTQLVKLNQSVKIKIDAFAGQLIEGEIEEIGPEEMSRTPASFANQTGGGVATQADREGNLVPLNATYIARVSVDNTDGAFRMGLRGRAKIRTGFQTLGGRVWEYLARTFHFEI